MRLNIFVLCMAGSVYCVACLARFNVRTRMMLRPITVINNMTAGPRPRLSCRTQTPACKGICDCLCCRAGSAGREHPNDVCRLESVYRPEYDCQQDQGSGQRRVIRVNLNQDDARSTQQIHTGKLEQPKGLPAEQHHEGRPHPDVTITIDQNPLNWYSTN